MNHKHFIQTQLILLKDKKKDIQSVKSSIVEYFLTTKASNQIQVQSVIDYVHFTINYYISNKNTKSQLFHSLLTLFTHLLLQIEGSTTSLFEMLLIPKVSFKYKKYVVKILKSFDIKTFPNGSDKLLIHLLFNSNSTKLQCLVSTILLQMNIDHKILSPLLLTSCDKLLTILNCDKIIQNAQLNILLHLLLNKLTTSNVLKELKRRYNGLSSDEIRELLHFIACHCNDSNDQKFSNELLMLIDNFPKTFYNKLDYLCDHPLTSIISSKLLSLQIVSPQEFCCCERITKESPQEVLFCAARVFENGYLINIDFEESFILKQISEGNIGMIDLLVYAPRLISNNKIKTYELFEQLLSSPSYIYHGYSTIGIIIHCIVRLFSKESFMMITNYLADNDINSQICETVGWSEDFTIRYMTTPKFEKLPKMNETEKCMILIDAFLQCHQNIDSHKRLLEESYVIPFLASKNTVSIALIVMKNHFKEDLIELIPMIIDQFWGDCNQNIHCSLIDLLVDTINSIGVEKVDSLMNGSTKIKHGTFNCQSLATNSFSKIFDFHFDFFVDSTIPREISEELLKPRLSKRIKTIIVNGVVDMMKNDILLDPVVLCRVLVIIIKEMKEYLNDLTKYFFLRDEIVEEALLLSLLQLIKTKEVNEVIKLIKELHQKNFIKGKRLYVGILGEMMNGYSNQIKTIFMKIINEVTDWGFGWELLRGIGSVVLNSYKFTGDLEKERVKWLSKGKETRKEDVETISKQKFSQLYDSITKL